jgi:hypothetical protein
MGQDLVLVVLSILGSRSFRAASAPINVEIELCCRRNSLSHSSTSQHSPLRNTQYVSSRRRPFPLHPHSRVAVGVAQDFTRQRLPPREAKLCRAQSGVNSTTTRKSEVSGAQKGNCQAWEGSELALCLRGVVVCSRLARPGPREAQAGEGLRELFPPQPARHANPGRAHRPRHLSNPHSLLLFI